MTPCQSIQNSYNAACDALSLAKSQLLTDQVQIRTADSGSPIDFTPAVVVQQRLSVLEQIQPPPTALIEMYLKWQTDYQNVICCQYNVDYWVTMAAQNNCKLVLQGA